IAVMRARQYGFSPSAQTLLPTTGCICCRGVNASAAYPNTVSSWKGRPTRRISLRTHAQWLASAARNLDDCFPGKRQHVTIGRNGEAGVTPAIKGIFVGKGGGGFENSAE